MNAFADWIKEPTELRAVLAILFHFALQGAQGIRWRTQFEDEVGTEGKEFVAFVLGKRVESFVADPGEIG